jgi:uncharacterized protein YggE
VTDHSSGVTVLGIGHASAPPNLATVDIGVSPLADSVAAASSRAQERARAVFAVLSSVGVDRDDMRTTQYRVEPEYRHEDGVRNLVGFRVTNSIRITFRDITAVGELIDRAVEAAGDDAIVGNVSFEVDDTSAASASAREMAWNDAKAKAEQLANLSGRGLGDVVSIVESVGRPPGPGPVARLAAEVDGTPIAPGASAIQVRLEVQFELDD